MWRNLPLEDYFSSELLESTSVNLSGEPSVVYLESAFEFFFSPVLVSVNFSRVCKRQPACSLELQEYI